MTDVTTPKIDLPKISKETLKKMSKRLDHNEIIKGLEGIAARQDRTNAILSDIKEAAKDLLDEVRRR